MRLIDSEKYYQYLQSRFDAINDCGTTNSSLMKQGIKTGLMWNIESMTGYKPRTTFYEDFSIADHFGSTAIRDTYCRAFNAWQNNIEYMTELVMVLNWKISEHYRRNYRLAEMYDELWRKADEWVYDHFDGDDLQYFIRTTD